MLNDGVYQYEYMYDWQRIRTMERSIPWFIAEIFENFRNKCLNIYELDPLIFFSTAWKACLKKIKAELELLTDADMFLIIGWDKIRDRICHAIHRHAKAINKYIKGLT